MTISFSKRQLLEVIQTVLLVVVLGLLVWSQPWDSKAGAAVRKVTVSGTATIEAEPDEYTFSPYLQKSGTDKEVLKKALTQEANDAVAKLKELGVEDKNLKVDASSYDYWYVEGNTETPMTVSLQIKVADKTLAQKVQDYLLTLEIEGQLTPLAGFSDTRQKELDTKAVAQASDDARTKAEAQAKLLGAKVGKVIEVSQGSNGAIPIAYDAVATSGAASDKSSSLPIQAGQNEYTQTVTVTYELK